MAPFTFRIGPITYRLRNTPRYNQVFGALYRKYKFEYNKQNEIGRRVFSCTLKDVKSLMDLDSKFK